MEPTEGASKAGRRILVIDDDPETARMLSAWFKDKYEVITADDGISGLATAASAEPALILLDLRMPGVDGITVAGKLKADAATRAIPIILLTACRDTDTKVQAFDVGADDYITKPFECEEVDARMEALLRRHAFLIRLQTTIRDLKSTNSELEQALMLDEKTGLYNFREFRRKLREEWLRSDRYGDPLSLVLLDVDDFKQVNDTFGHQAGDQVLVELATLVAGGARVTDMAARYGGEEFAVILSHTGARMAARVAQRICSAVHDFIFLRDTTPTRVTVSAGVATYPASAGIETVDSLVRVADICLYEAKEKGKNRVISAPAARTATRKTTGNGHRGRRTYSISRGPSSKRSGPPTAGR